MKMIVTGLRGEFVPRAVRQYEDRYESVPLLQARVRRAGRNGGVVTQFVYHYPDGSRANGALPAFFCTDKDAFETIRALSASAAELERFAARHIAKAWRGPSDAAGTEWEAVLLFLQALDLQPGRGGQYKADFTLTFSEKPRPLFRWADVPAPCPGDFAENGFCGTPFKTEDGRFLLRVPAKLAASAQFPQAEGFCYEFGTERVFGADGRHLRAREVLLPPTVRRVEEGAFAGCCALERLELPLHCRVAFNALSGAGDAGPRLTIRYICSA